MRQKGGASTSDSTTAFDREQDLRAAVVDAARPITETRGTKLDRIIQALGELFLDSDGELNATPLTMQWGCCARAKTGCNQREPCGSFGAWVDDFTKGDRKPGANPRTHLSLSVDVWPVGHVC